MNMLLGFMGLGTTELMIVAGIFILLFGSIEFLQDAFILFHFIFYPTLTTFSSKVNIKLKLLRFSTISCLKIIRNVIILTNQFFIRIKANQCPYTSMYVLSLHQLANMPYTIHRYLRTKFIREVCVVNSLFKLV